MYEKERIECREILASFLRDQGNSPYERAMALCNNSDEARDLVQEAGYRVLRNWWRFDNTRDLGAWFYSILRNAHTDRRKHCDSKRYVSMELCVLDGAKQIRLGDCVADNQPGIMAQLEQAEIVAYVQRAIGRLPPVQGVTLRHLLREGTYKGVAESLAIPVGTVRSRISRARIALRRKCNGRLKQFLDEG